MPTYKEVVPALKWRHGTCMSMNPSADELAEGLSIEGAPYHTIPGRVWPSVKAFRHMRSDARVNAARRYLREHENAKRR